MNDSGKPTLAEVLPRFARFLDLRFVLAALFAIFGVLVTLTGIFATPAEVAKAAGINISFWTGIGLLIVSGIFTLWLLSAPPEVPQGAEPEDE
ncbi:MAG: hypothetical protein U0904_05915 [Candidatus Nanopelagicales bacterium]|nr:hypothetical protein [Candidatus Nanopelagicales bacterium]